MLKAVLAVLCSSHSYRIAGRYQDSIRIRIQSVNIFVRTFRPRDGTRVGFRDWRFRILKYEISNLESAKSVMAACPIPIDDVRLPLGSGHEKSYRQLGIRGLYLTTLMRLRRQRFRIRAFLPDLTL